MGKSYQFIIGPGEIGARLDHYLVSHLPTDVSRAMIQRGIKAGLVVVDDRQVKAHYKLRQGEVVSVRFTSQPAPAKEFRLSAQPIPFEIIHEDDTVLVVNKPPGLVTHPAPGHWDGTLVNAILWHFQKGAQGSRLKAEGESAQGLRLEAEGKDFLRSSLQPPASSLERMPQRAGIVHRLDKDTSGLLLVAKTESAHQLLSRQLKARHIRRSYLAVVEGHLPLDTGTITVPIGRHLTQRKIMTVRHLGGRTAVTHYRVLRRTETTFRVQGSGLGVTTPNPEPRTLSSFPYTVLDVALETGRTHQIRVHMAHVGHPIFGDVTYGKHPPSFWSSVGIPRQLLHAYRLTFQHPVSHETISVVAPVPDDMRPWIGNIADTLLQGRTKQ